VFPPREPPRVLRRTRAPRGVRGVTRLGTSPFRSADAAPTACAAVLRGFRCQCAAAHPGLHLVDRDGVDLRWSDGTPSTDDWVLDAFDS
jgi:hypothetical protein